MPTCWPFVAPYCLLLLFLRLSNLTFGKPRQQSDDRVQQKVLWYFFFLCQAFIWHHVSIACHRLHVNEEKKSFSHSIRIWNERNLHDICLGFPIQMTPRSNGEMLKLESWADGGARWAVSSEQWVQVKCVDNHSTVVWLWVWLFDVFRLCNRCHVRWKPNGIILSCKFFKFSIHVENWSNVWCQLCAWVFARWFVKVSSLRWIYDTKW